ncbi:DUF5984 family protein [Streptomyces sp. NPDC096193]|uniref:DUF5984 family protein n=1 Tax=Streptomyces sp. NPDC096193 TaxID=3155821 RepID=UPI00331B0F8B
MIHFRFGLRPVADIPAWGGEKPSLHWFALTEGWYWIEIGDDELLRYSDRTLQKWVEEGGAEDAPPYVDYYVVRIWEDLLEMLPEIMEPVPEDLADFVAEELLDWPSREDAPQIEAAGLWHVSHSMYTGPLQNAPHIRWWRTIIDGDDVVTVAWRHQPEPDIEFAGPLTGLTAVPTSSFVAAVTEFDLALLAAMDQRISMLEATGPPPGVDLDLRHLRREHEERSTRLQRAWTRECSTDWGIVRAGARKLSAATADLEPGTARPRQRPAK